MRLDWTFGPPWAARMLRRAMTKLSDSRFRYRLYSALAIVLFLVAWIGVVLRSWVLDRDVSIIVSDARWYYVYLPSLVIDGDWDFTNQITARWDIENTPALLEDRTARGVVRNQFPIGLALTLAPSFVTAHLLTRVVHLATRSVWFAPDGYSLLYQLLCVGTVMALGLASMIMTDALLLRRLAIVPRAAAAAIVVYWMGSHYLYYYVREPLMAHVVSTFWVALVLFVTHAMASATRSWQLPVLTLAVAMAVVCRPTNLFVLPMVLYALAVIRARGELRSTLRLWPLVLLALFPLLVQIFVWWAMVGSAFGFGYFDARFAWTRPKLVQTLLSSNHGLFVWSPLLVLGVWGGTWYSRHRGGSTNAFWLSLLASSALLWYANSSRQDWWFGHAFGARAFLELSPLFIAGLAMCFEHVETTGRQYRPWVMIWTGTTVLYSWLLMILYIAERIPRLGPLF